MPSTVGADKNGTLVFVNFSAQDALILKISVQGGEGRLSEAENLRSSSEIQSIFNLLGRTGKNIIFIIRVGI